MARESGGGSARPCWTAPATIGATRVYLESNTILEPAINLYRKLGFKSVEGGASPYGRCNIQMEVWLAGDGPQR